MYKIVLAIKNKTIRPSWIYCVNTWKHVFIYNKVVFLHVTGPDYWGHKSLESWLNYPYKHWGNWRVSNSRVASKVTECSGRGADSRRACFSLAPPLPFQMVFPRCSAVPHFLLLPQNLSFNTHLKYHLFLELLLTHPKPPSAGAHCHT